MTALVTTVYSKRAKSPTSIVAVEEAELHPVLELSLPHHAAGSTLLVSRPKNKLKVERRHTLEN